MTPDQNDVPDIIAQQQAQLQDLVDHDTSGLPETAQQFADLGYISARGNVMHNASMLEKVDPGVLELLDQYAQARGHKAEVADDISTVDDAYRERQIYKAIRHFQQALREVGAKAEARAKLRGGGKG